MGLAQAARSGLENYFVFRGRASRSEYWYFVLFICICALPAALVDQLVIGKPVFQVLVTLATFVPHLAALVRRLHDTGRSGWYYFIALVPLAGVFILIYWLCQPGSAQSNQYGGVRTSADVSPDHNAEIPRIRLTATFQNRSIEVDDARPMLRIGRSQGNDIVVADMLASGNHARIECRGDQFFLTDQSLNGTFVRVQGMPEMEVKGREIALEGSGLIGLGRSTGAQMDLCIRFATQRRR